MTYIVKDKNGVVIIETSSKEEAKEVFAATQGGTFDEISAQKGKLTQ